MFTRMAWLGLVLVGACGGGDDATDAGPADAVWMLCSGEWQVEEVAQMAQPQVRFGFALDPEGGAHALYVAGSPGSGALTHAGKIGSSWQMETLAPVSNSASLSSQLEIDATGMLHAAWIDGTRVRYARRAGDATSWEVEEIDDLASNAIALSLALAPDGTPQVAYSWGTPETLNLAVRGAGGWTIEQVTGQNVGPYQLAVDDLGHAHVAYRDETTTTAWYATNASGAWTTEEVDPAMNSGWAISIAVDGGEVLYAYSALGAGSLQLARGGAGSWEVDTLDPASGWDATEIAVAPSGDIEAIYSTWTAFEARHGMGGPGNWQTEMLSMTPVTPGKLRLRSDDDRRAAWSEFNKAVLRYAYWCLPSP